MTAAVRSSRQRRRPVLVSVAVVALALLALFAAYPVFGITKSLVEFGVPLADVPRSEAFWSLGVALLPYALVFALAAFGVWKGWRLAHAVSILIAAWLVFSFVTGDVRSGSVLTIGPFALALVALVTLLASWRHFWERRHTRLEAETGS